MAAMDESGETAGGSDTDSETSRFASKPTSTFQQFKHAFNELKTEHPLWIKAKTLILDSYIRRIAVKSRQLYWYTWCVLLCYLRGPTRVLVLVDKYAPEVAEAFGYGKRSPGAMESMGIVTGRYAREIVVPVCVSREKVPYDYGHHVIVTASKDFSRLPKQYYELILVLTAPKHWEAISLTFDKCVIYFFSERVHPEYCTITV